MWASRRGRNRYTLQTLTPFPHASTPLLLYSSTPLLLYSLTSYCKLRQCATKGAKGAGQDGALPPAGYDEEREQRDANHAADKGVHPSPLTSVVGRQSTSYESRQQGNQKDKLPIGLPGCDGAVRQCYQ